MTMLEKIARRKLSLLELATDMQNVSRACRFMGYLGLQLYKYSTVETELFGAKCRAEGTK